MTESCPALVAARILVLDSLPELTNLLRDVFDEADVTTANTGSEAMAVLRDQSFDLVVLDPYMLRPDGWDVLEFLAAARPELLRRCIVLSGDSLDRCVSGRLRGCSLTTLPKPFRLGELRRAAQRILHSKPVGLAA